MIKGCKRQIILINGNESALFESAYFVLREDAESGGAKHDDMVREANRIIESRLPDGVSRIKRRAELRRSALRLGIFLGGGLAGASLTVLFSLLS